MENAIKKNIPSALAISASVIVVFPLVVILDGIYIGYTYRIFTPLVPLIFLSIVLIILSMIIFRSNKTVLYKAVYTVVPITIVLYYIYNGLSGCTVLESHLLGALFTVCILVYLFLKKKNWRYYFSVISTTIALLIFELLVGVL
jgi:uncharacterized membrane protein YoaK (UPF0700 family)